MRVHHLNCGTMAPLGGRLVDGTGGLLRTARIVCHCLLVETGDGLVLVDTGFGLGTIERRREALGSRFLLLTRPRLDPAETAAHQVARLGYEPRDVRHIVLTHLDVDHVGGLADFPEAQVHVHADELAAAHNPVTRLEKERYRASAWAHGPRWVEHATGGERWFGFESARELPGLPPELALIPLPGHTRGHVGVAIDLGSGTTTAGTTVTAGTATTADTEDDTGADTGPGTGPGRARWLLHAGDAYFFHGQIDAARPHCTPVLTVFQSVMQADRADRLHNVQRLRELAAQGSAQVLSAHDAAEFDRAGAAGDMLGGVPGPREQPGPASSEPREPASPEGKEG